RARLLPLVAHRQLRVVERVFPEVRAGELRCGDREAQAACRRPSLPLRRAAQRDQPGADLAPRAVATRPGLLGAGGATARRRPASESRGSTYLPGGTLRIRCAVVLHEYGGLDADALRAAAVLQDADAAPGPDTYSRACASTGVSTGNPAAGAGRARG